MKVCLTHSLEQFEVSSPAIVVLIFRIKARLDAPPCKNIRHIDNVGNCHDGDGKRGKDWSKEEDQQFLAAGRVLFTILPYSNEDIEHSHGDEDDTKDDDAPYLVALVDEGDPVVKVGANVEQERPEVWVVERRTRGRIESDSAKKTLLG